MAGTTKGSLVELTVSETLYRAADLIEERGWTQGEGWVGATKETRLCLEGGIMAALGLDWNDYHRVVVGCPAYTAVSDYLGRTPFAWNDVEGRTASEVIEVLRSCAVIEAAKEQETAWSTYAKQVTA